MRKHTWVWAMVVVCTGFRIQVDSANELLLVNESKLSSKVFAGYTCKFTDYFAELCAPTGLQRRAELFFRLHVLHTLYTS